jgi:squamous cell carcinoma antigen recognized by T-cells 3
MAMGTPNGPSTVDSLMPDTRPPPQHAHIASSLSSAESRRLAELAAAITSNTFDFSAHLEYVSLLHTGFARHVESGGSAATGYELLDTLKQARNAMDQIFPVGETLWVQWLTDENMLATTIDDRVALMELHRKSVLEEPCSAQLWLLYGDYMYYLWSSCNNDDDARSTNSSEDDDGSKYGWTAEDRMIGKDAFQWDSMFNVWEQGVMHTQWHINDSNIVWDRHMQILLGDIERNSTPEKISRIRDKFVDRLTNRAHATWDQTLSMYSSFVSSYLDASNYEKAMVAVTKRSARTKKVFELREPYEFKVQQARERMDKNAEWAAYSEYLDWELRMKGVFSKDLINGLYERATTRFSTDASLWRDYVDFLVEYAPLSAHSPPAGTKTSNGNEDHALPSLLEVLERATRHCPWSGELWSNLLLEMEAEGKSYQEIEAAKHKATVSGLIDMRGLDDLMKVYVAWTGYLSRRAFAAGASEDDVDMAEVGILSSLEHVQKVLTDTISKEKALAGDPQIRLERMYIKLLFKTNDQQRMRQMWNDLSMKPGVSDSYDFWNRYYIWSLVIFERNRHTDIMNGDQNTNAYVRPNQNPNQPWREGTQILERGLARVDSLDWPEQLIQQYINHCEQHETVLEYRKALIAARRATRQVAERREREQAAWKTQQEPSLVQASLPTPDYAASESTKRKRDVEGSTANDSNKKIKHDDMEPADVAMAEATEEQLAPRRDREHTVVFVKNLPESATDLKVRQFFRDCGTINSLVLVDNAASSTKTATVEFESKEDALYAQTKAAKPFDGQSIEVEFSTGSTLWVANYPPTADEKYIRSLFQSYGEILQVRFPSIKLNTSRRFCYVQFSSPKDAQTAAEKMNGKVLDGTFQLQAKISDPSKKQERSGALHEGREIVVKNVDWNANDDDILKLVSDALGQQDAVEKVHIPRTLDGRSKGVAFISLATMELAEEAVSKLDNTPFRSRTIKVEKAIEKGKRLAGRIVRAGTEDGSERASVNDADMDDTKASEPSGKNAKRRTIALLGVPDTVNAARLDALVSKYGEIRKLTLRTDHAGAMVEFADEKEAGSAGLALEGQEIDGAKLRVGTVEALFRERPFGKTTGFVGKKPTQLAFKGVVSRPRVGGPKARLGLGAKPASRGAKSSDSKDKMDVDKVDGETVEKKSNADFREMFLQGRK